MLKCMYAPVAKIKSTSQPNIYTNMNIFLYLHFLQGPSYAPRSTPRHHQAQKHEKGRHGPDQAIHITTPSFLHPPSLTLQNPPEPSRPSGTLDPVTQYKPDLLTSNQRLPCSLIKPQPQPPPSAAPEPKPFTCSYQASSQAPHRF